MNSELHNRKRVVAASGNTGECSWTITGRAGKYILTISGNGAMDDYNDSAESPWSKLKDEIQTLVIEEGVTSVGARSFINCSKLASASLPGSVIAIGNGAFSGCRKLSSAVIPDSVTTIGEWVFSGCHKLTSVIISGSVTEIGELAFFFCRKLASVTNYSVVPQEVLGEVFPHVKDLELRVPREALEAYKRSSTWKHFGNIASIDEE
ncbi:MAG: leucine-rich repeat domain-containing protein [Odoribacteraceae bacterium]|jgi:hypothetical protein|nr:leucine-rich repeat domain-containing protein [Odoribacteraceae bacterium]